MRGFRSTLVGAVLAAALSGAAAGQTPPTLGEDYPTVAVADYVLGCMKANGETRTMLERCSCSIDIIKTLLPYERYEEAEAFLSLGLIAGERGAMFRTSEQSKAAITDLRRAQIEAELRCF